MSSPADDTDQRINLQPPRLLGRSGTKTIPQGMESRQHHPEPLVSMLTGVRQAGLITPQKSRGHVTSQVHSGIGRTTPTAGITAKHRGRNSNDVGLSPASGRREYRAG